MAELDYITLPAFRDYLRINSSVGADDNQAQLAITAASRAIDKRANRNFGIDDPATQKQIEAGGCTIVATPDISSTDNLVVTASYSAAVFDRTFTTLTINTDFVLLPEIKDEATDPYTGIHLLVPAQTLRITAEWGWSAIPDVIEQACLLQASRFLARRDAPFGIAGSPSVGSEMRLLAYVDPDVAVIVDTKRRWYGAV